MDKSFLMESSLIGLKRIVRAVELSKAFGFKGIRYLIPRQLAYQELGYGQGEGQFDIGGIEVGIYVGDSGYYILVIHDVVENRWNESVALINEFCEWWGKIAKSPVIATLRICGNQPS